MQAMSHTQRKRSMAFGRRFISFGRRSQPFGRRGLYGSEGDLHHSEDGLYAKAVISSKRRIKSFAAAGARRTRRASTVVTCPLFLASNAGTWRPPFPRGYRLSVMCVLLFQEQQKVEEEWSPRSVDMLVFLSRQLHRFLLLYCDNDQVLDDVGRNIGLLAEIEKAWRRLAIQVM